MHYVLVIFPVADPGFFRGWGGSKKYVSYKYIDSGGGSGPFNHPSPSALKVYRLKEIIKHQN